MKSVQCFADLFDKSRWLIFFILNWKKVTTAIEKNPDKEPPTIMFFAALGT